MTKKLIDKLDGGEAVHWRCGMCDHEWDAALEGSKVKCPGCGVTFDLSAIIAEQRTKAAAQ